MTFQAIQQKAGDFSVIRFAEESDIPQLLRMGEEFFNASGYSDSMELSAEKVEATFRQLIPNRQLLTDGESGMIGFIVYPFYMAHHSVAQELFWWVDKDKRGTSLGIKLLKAAEEEAKKQGAESMMMIALSQLGGDKVSNIYEKLGYTPREINYMRAI